MALAPQQALAETVGDADVIRIVRAQDPAVVVARAKTMVSSAVADGTGLYPNPSVTWDRAHLPGDSARSEDTVSITVPLEWNGQRAAASLLARADALSASADATRLESVTVEAALVLFYDALMLHAEVAIATAAAAHLSEAARIVGKRHDRGANSGYQRARLELEAELAHSARRQAEAKAAQATQHVALLLGLDPAQTVIDGNLAVGETGETESANGGRPVTFASVRALEEGAALAEQASQAAKRGWLPLLAIKGGLRIDRDTETRYGYVAGLELTLPILSSGGALKREAGARAQLLRAEASSHGRDRLVARAHATAAMRAAQSELQIFVAATQERLELLERASLSGYREGELTVVELVDAQRAKVEVDRRVLALRLAAKQAEVALRAARGEFE